MKKILWTAILIFLCALIYANDKIQFKLTPGVSFYVGQTEELVFVKYLDSGTEKQSKLSELDWQVGPLCLVDLDFDWKLKDVDWGAGLKFAIPGGQSIMADSDWLNVEKLPEYKDDKTFLKTNYSESVCRTDLFFSAIGRFGYGFYPTEKIRFKVFAELEYRYIALSAWGMMGLYAVTDSEGYYKSWDSLDSVAKYFPTEKNVISLAQHWGIFLFGVDLDFSITKNFSLDLSLGVIPAEFCVSIDNHWMRSLIFEDLVFDGFNGAKINLNAEWKLTEKDSIGLGVNLQGIFEAKGDSYVASNKDKIFYKDVDCASGVDSKSMEIKISYKKSF